MIIKRTPKFSILLPTFNRASILPIAIKSVLQQTVGDFELIVSNGGSTDNTREAVLGLADDRIKYFESENRLTMAENYERALSLASGEFIIFFSDDDAFVPAMLEKVEQVISREGCKMLVFPFASYFHDDFSTGIDKIPANTITVAPFTGMTWWVESSEDINRMLRIYCLSNKPVPDKKINPLIGNIVCHRSVIDSLGEKTPTLFATVPVDIYFITLILGEIDRYCVLDEPLLVWSQWRHNSSVYADPDIDILAHYEKLLAGKTLDFVPFKAAAPLNCAANALLKAKNDSGIGLEAISADWNTYFVKIYESLRYLQAEGQNVDEQVNALLDSLKNQPTEVRDYFREATSGNLLLFRQWIKLKLRFARKPLGSLTRAVNRALNTSGTSDAIVIEGKDAGFSTLLEATDYLALRRH